MLLMNIHFKTHPRAVLKLQLIRGQSWGGSQRRH